MRALAAVDSGQLHNARELAQRMLDHPSSEKEAIEARRLLGHVHRDSGDLAAADAHYLAALQRVDANPVIQTESPLLRSSILLDRANLAAFWRSDHDAAVELYDILAQNEERSISSRRKSAQNAAMLRYTQGRYAEAITRLQTLLDSPMAATLDVSEVISLKSHIASWLLRADRLPEGFEVYLQIWNDYGNRMDEAVFLAIEQVARYSPMGLACDRRIGASIAMLNKADELRAMPQPPRESPTPRRLDQFERDALTVIASTERCDEYAEVIAWARDQLSRE
ncbi:MAG: hypothetical protein KF859_03135 [Phycisphaeraceae bacterium]|nr:hypothetical protein [Phycisphaeraceae bacterium]